MKMRIQAIVTFEWEEDTENWQSEGTPPTTKEQLVECVRNYAEDDYDYFLSADIANLEIAEAPRK